MSKPFSALTRIATGLMLAASLTATAAATELTFFYPIAVGGPITKVIDDMAAASEKENPGIRVKPVYSGSYQDTITKVVTAVKGGDAPHVSVLLSTDMYTLIDEDAVVPFDDLVKSADDKAWMKSFYPGFMQNSQTGGKTWGIPFQRSTVVMYWNKELFAQAGLDPERPPKNWKELIEYGKKLTKRDATGKVTTWGVQVPSSGFPYWLFQTFTTQNGIELMNAAGNETYFDKPQAVEAMQYWVDLSRKHGIHPPGVVEWGTTPKDFFERKAAIIYTTTGNLTNIRANAGFNFGVAMLPAGKHPGSPTGGGNFHIFKRSTPEERAAALKFVRWMTTPQRAAEWSIATGYVAVSPEAWKTDTMKKYVADFPAPMVARDQLEYAVAELSTHENQRVTKALNDGLQAALNGTKTPEQAMRDAQREAQRILRPYR
ncbi:MAG: ABC transporter substrate-binding protein [Candidatus Dactylopiibacterium carminicum]|uniref:ABC transporter substrate-binding protein n=1 Tax=Candidatus Dactylopiibacterium carminicum TaxID=857335 RepID=A0A272ERY2_9RHOO|nr:ABC transporter substrate-binding protein [Candidatus Dactylopiibacterium carminicum]KAF7598945.1 ABC transporter substrate-binding protein [Candidatus Dactylopiibacterium carminicum]PAS92868.1 MAG: ABC transporter substrate-binding protein [Candidatus Dactylopiibacterium carminicum]PAS96374.1 MAG: ABC transporter substrate-binding protein [Candidatus Dactylopiibacterium carminicum]PAS98963.1 MAG: ABC transporter substrate-binding protein [Candidatus Dactylopiibacterium carminicum]